MTPLKLTDLRLGDLVTVRSPSGWRSKYASFPRPVGGSVAEIKKDSVVIMLLSPHPRTGHYWWEASSFILSKGFVTLKKKVEALEIPPAYPH